MSRSDDFRKQTLESDFGQRAKVERVAGTNEIIKREGQLLRDSGARLNPQPQAMEYLGSAAVHIYQSPILKQLFFVTQTPWGDTTEDLAGKAIAALRSDSMVAFGQKRQTKRSGW